MNGLPLHPTVVHFPIVLSILLPIFALGAWWAIRRGGSLRIWLLPIAVALALTASAFVALRTGQAEEEKVESVVSEAALSGHEEAAERFLVLSAVVLLVLVGGVMRGSAGRVARIAGTAGALALVAAGVQVGHAGGELVYRHGAAAAYTSQGGSAPTAAPARTEADDD